MPFEHWTLFSNELWHIYTNCKQISFFNNHQGLICVVEGKLHNEQDYISPHNTTSTNLAEAVLNAYTTLGNDLFNTLDGKIALAIIDLLSNNIVGFRDHFGLQNLFYQAGDKSFTVATDLLDIVNYSSSSVNYTALKNYLDFNALSRPYCSETLFLNVSKVLPAHKVVCNLKDFKIIQECCWNTKIPDYVNRTPSELIGLFKETLKDSIKKNTLPNEKICSNLSGGLDSSSISSISKLLGCDVNSLYFCTGDRPSDERHFANEVVERWELEHHEIHASENPLELAKRNIEICGLPDSLFIPGYSFFSLAEKAKELGSKKILTGDGGDAVVAYGTEYLDELVNDGNWSLLKSSIEQYVSKRDLNPFFEDWNRKSNRQKSKLYTKFFIERKIIDFVKKGNLKRAFSIWNRFLLEYKFVFFIPFQTGFTFIRNKLSKKNKKYSLLNLVNQQHKTPLFEFKGTKKDLDSFRKEHFGYSFTNLNMSVIEQQNTVMKSLGVQAIHPFLDKRLVEIAVAVNSETRFAEGNCRGTLRYAMKDILPETVRLRTSKADFSHYFMKYFEQLWHDFGTENSDSHRVWDIVDKLVFDQLLLKIFDHKVTINKKTKYIWLANRTIHLALWLDFFDKLQAKHLKIISNEST
ncbi:asparagine synthase-related protein [Lacihabitans soyangensis]|uniref:asparagine synthase (glutamine-hydrolyzing) n=1 Tax=Lacihabitans soyangensis TaxID=869394 RepID=A0AAE3H118_9BACT|nr:asparagine synthetase B family protein [Lacihabitans soyangensis]MCP9762943.1 asparagine synthetase B family protein [Lacihabitans soyangensis]